MALANIAELLYTEGFSVLMIDWDLEAPGLDTYFPNISQEVRSHLGLIDLLQDYKSYVSSNLPPSGEDPWPFPELSRYWNYVYSPREEGRGVLRLMSAGKRDGEAFGDYASRVKSFDWGDFLEKWSGENYLRAFKRKIEDLAQITLIDSRSGVNEISGICTRQLADVVVSFTSLSRQSIEGTMEFVKRLGKDQTSTTLVVPARVEQQSELVERNRSEKKFKSEFDKLRTQHWCDLEKSLWDLRIPYVPLYAFEEIVAIREQRENGERIASELVEAYRKIKEAMVDFSPSKKAWYQNRLVLIVDGSSEWQEALKEIIVKTGGECEITGKQEEAISLVSSVDYALVVLELHLSSYDYEGVEVLEALKVRGIGVPVVIVTTARSINLNISSRFDNIQDRMFFKGPDFERKEFADYVTRYL
jgi:hypothetical protein